MTIRATCLIVMISILPSAVSAQSVEQRHADYSASIALHISAAVLGVAATACFVVGSTMALGTAFGGASGTTDPAQGPLLASGGIGLLVAIGVGIAATVVHFQTRNAATGEASVSWLPLVWADANGAGAGVTLRL